MLPFTMSRVEPLEPGESADEEINAMLEELGETMYADARPWGVFAQAPGMFKKFAALYEEMWFETDLDESLVEVTRLKIAEMTRCGYCQTIRMQHLRDEVKHKEEAVFDEAYDELSEREALAVQLAEKMCGDPSYIDDEFFDELKETFTDKEIVELAMTNAVFIGAGKLGVTFQLQPSEESPYPEEVEYPLDDPTVAMGRADEEV